MNSVTDEELDELLRWAAEEMLGWNVVTERGVAYREHEGKRYIGVGTPISHTPLHSLLLGWAGFAHAVEAAIERGCAEMVWKDVEESDADDPGIAAWQSLREALSQ